MKGSIDLAQERVTTLPNKVMMNLKKNLGLLLDRRGLSAAELARKSGVSKQVLSLWLGGAKPKNVDQIKKVADALSVSLDHLLFGEDTDATKMTGLEALMGDEWLGGLFEVRFRRVKKDKS